VSGLFRYIVGNATRDSIDLVSRVRAEDSAAGQVVVEAQTGLDSTRVVYDDTVEDHRLGVQDNAGQMEVIDVAPPAAGDPVDTHGLRATYNKIIAGEIPTPTEHALFTAHLMKRIPTILPAETDYANKASMESLRDKLGADTITAGERDDALQNLLELFVGPYVAP